MGKRRHFWIGYVETEVLLSYPVDTHLVVCFFYKYVFQEHGIKLKVKILETQRVDRKGHRVTANLPGEGM